MKFSFFLFVVAGALLMSCGTSRKSAPQASFGHSELKTRYEKEYGIQLTNNSNVKLYSAIDKWLGVPHRMGACDRTGIDCSCLINALCKEAYNCNTPRDTRALSEHCRKISKEEIAEGDILFFQVKGDKPDHVGLYLANGKFVHTSVKKGVMISDMNEAYFKKAFLEAGRMKCL